MYRSRRILPCLALLLVLSCRPAPSMDSIQGLVKDEHGPLAGAIVRVKATDKFTITDLKGNFTLDHLQPGQAVLLTAWAEGYFNGGGEAEVMPGSTGVEITLERHADSDNPDYDWLSAFTQPEIKASNCQNCHSQPETSALSEGYSLPFEEWRLDAHSRSAQNPRFLSMYLGQDLSGNQSPLTRHANDRDYGRIPLPPDPAQPYYGPGYKLDFPSNAGNCAACHTPAASIDAAYETDPTRVSGVGAEGVACDFCHKVWDVRLDPGTGLPFANMPGVLSFEFRRPSAGHQFFAGPYDDVAPGEDTYSPVQKQSQFCAACHFGIFWDQLVYNSFGEWLDSPYSASDTGKTCQDCHMPQGGADHFARISEGGVTRDPQTIFSHLMPGAMDEELLKNAVTLETDTSRVGNRLIVDVTVTNDLTGHSVPTDSPLREMILLVAVTDGDGNPSVLLSGETIPDWGGVGDPDQGYYAGLPGKIYSKLLSELWTEVSPTAAYWNQTRLVSDNRLAAMASDSTQYIFAVEHSQELTVEVALLFRRAYKELMDQKGWDAPDIVMEHLVTKVRTSEE